MWEKPVASGFRIIVILSSTEIFGTALTVNQCLLISRVERGWVFQSCGIYFVGLP